MLVNLSIFNVTDGCHQQESSDMTVHVEIFNNLISVNALALERRYQKNEKKKQKESGKGVLKGLVVTDVVSLHIWTGTHLVRVPSVRTRSERYLIGF